MTVVTVVTASMDPQVVVKVMVTAKMAVPVAMVAMVPMVLMAAMELTASLATLFLLIFGTTAGSLI
jgi:hypothetical protein